MREWPRPGDRTRTWGKQRTRCPDRGASPEKARSAAGAPRHAWNAVLLFGALAATGVLAWWWLRPREDTVSGQQPVAYVGNGACAECHPAQAAAGGRAH